MLRRLLANQLYIGKVQHRGETYAGEHAAIIDETVWRRVQELLLKERARGSVRKIRVKQPSMRALKPERHQVAPERVPRIARLMALAVKLELMMKQGVVSDYATLATVGRVSQPRLTQIMNLRHLAPDIQEELLFLSSETAEQYHICERAIRQLSSLLLWDEQRAKWAALTTLRR